MSIRSMIPEPVIRPLRSLRYLPDRLRHASRRRRALARLADLDVGTAVFICHGNINRSAYAAAVFSRSVPPARSNDVRVSSAGFIGPNRPASELAREVAGRRSVDLSGHRSRLVNGGELATTDLIVVMNTTQRRDVCRLTGNRKRSEILILGDLDPQPIDRRTIQDPYGHPVAVFEQVFDRIDRCMDQLAAALWRR